MIDSHCHLADPVFAPDLDAIVARAQAAGVARVLCIISSDTADELVQAERVRAAWPAVQFATAIHPHRSGAYAGRIGEAVATVERAITTLGAVALGEMGLEYHYDLAPRDVQHQVFAAQVELAVQRDLPVAIHTREAFPDTVAILREAGQGRVRGVIHCFTGTADEARMALDLGFYLSIPGIVTFPKAGALREVVRQVPMDRLLVETDAPYLAPVPYRGKQNEPAYLMETIAALAALTGVAEPAMRETVAANYDAWISGRRVDTPASRMV